MPTPQQSKAIMDLSAFALAFSSGDSTNIDQAEVFDKYKQLASNLFTSYGINTGIIRACAQIDVLKTVPAKNTFSRTKALNSLKTYLQTDINDVQSNIPTHNELIDALFLSNQALLNFINPQQNLKVASSIAYSAHQSFVPPPRTATPSFLAPDVTQAPVDKHYQPSATLVH